MTVFLLASLELDGNDLVMRDGARADIRTRTDKLSLDEMEI
jgi:hypothetical protein